MEQKGNRLFIRGMESCFNEALRSTAAPRSCSLHFNQGEDFFIRLADEVMIPSFPVHHDIRVHHAVEVEKQALLAALTTLAPHVGKFLQDMQFFFDPTENQKPSFIQFLNCEGQLYAGIIRLDLAFRASTCRVVQRGTNDQTASYASRHFVVEADLIPLLDRQRLADGSLELTLSQTISETWIGETGRGYFLQGIWLDREISKFFTRLFLPRGKRLYPYYPLNCKYRSTTFQLVDLSPESRIRACRFLHQARQVLEPNIRLIEESLHRQDFSEELDSFVQLKTRVDPAMEAFFTPYAIRSYLNEQEMKEYEITF